MDLLHMKCANSKMLTKLSDNDINQCIKNQIPNWHFDIDNNVIYRNFEFKNFKQTMFFINAVAYLCEQEIHHPEMKIGYNFCKIQFNTHDISGISINDIICAYKIDNL